MFRALRPFRLEGRQVNKYDLLPEVPSHMEGTFRRAGFIEPYKPVDLGKLTKTGLLKLADDLGVEVPDGMRVADIRELLKGEI